MESINMQIWKALRTDPAIMRDMGRELINIRALAKYLIEKYDLRASLDAVISSIRRFPIDQYEEEERILNHIFRDSIISTKNNITCITIYQAPHTVVGKLNNPLPTMRVTTGIDQVRILVESPHADDILKHFKNAQVVKDLSELTVTVAEKAIKTKGVLARIAAELALANINIHEMLVCPPQFLIYVAEKDVVKAHERIMSLTVS